jgi:hypothetical protein
MVLILDRCPRHFAASGASVPKMGNFIPKKRGLRRFVRNFAVFDGLNNVLDV